MQAHADWTAASATAEARTDFIHRTYQHLALAIAAFVGIEALLFQVPGIEKLVLMMTGGYGWLVVLGVWMAVSHLATRWAQSATSTAIQYIGLGVFVFVEAVVFLPMLWFATFYVGGDVVPTAALITGVTFGGLTATVMLSKKDFSFMGGILRAAGWGAMGFIVASIVFGFSLGTLFAAVMVVFAAGAIVYETSNVMLHYRTDQHVAAALGLFAGVALLFWYVLRLVMAARD